MAAQLIVAVIVVTPDSGFFQRSVHLLDLTVRPGMFGLCETVIDIVCVTRPFEGVRPDDFASCQAFFDFLSRGTDIAWCREVRAVIRKNRVDFVRHGRNQGSQKVRCDGPGCFLMQLGRRPVIPATATWEDCLLVISRSTLNSDALRNSAS